MKIKISSILILLILVPTLLWWGFFYLKSPQKALIYETKSLEVSQEEEQEIKEELATVEVENIQKPAAESESSEDKNTDAVVVVEEIKPEIKKDSKNSMTITDKLVSWGFDNSKGRKIDTIILHSSYNALGGDEYDLEKLILEYKEYGVSPHYVIDRKGEIFRLVKDENVAYHAGESKVPDGRKGVNSFSLGIELMNTKEDKYTIDQYNAVKDLILFLKSKYSIKYVLGHNQISPSRKTDPWNFNWEKINK